ncbi:hypothetical protein IPZ58_12360 [Streptomyces roseoverticillatus]|uniref:hypothetical protein n=1 Tax=Streptomyces roseoverticillatus TaxID=66429 RepID=UPI001F34398C|nr:hypothetical protein [Streptomyces roseoverticillatus]MCF3102371.1 hypothetical protein [Streptomyces roseoverticillatus]
MKQQFIVIHTVTVSVPKAARGAIVNLLRTYKHPLRPRAAVNAMLPWADLPEALLEVFSWTGSDQENTSVTEGADALRYGRLSHVDQTYRRLEAYFLELRGRPTTVNKGAGPGGPGCSRLGWVTVRRNSWRRNPS